MKSFALAAILAGCIAASASAATIVTFDDLPYGNDYPIPASYVEQGVTVRGAAVYWDGPAWWVDPGQLHIEDGTSVRITTGGLFSALTMDVVGLSQYSFYGSYYRPIPRAYTNVRVEGYLGATLVAVGEFSTGLRPREMTYYFGPAFASIDRLMIIGNKYWGQTFRGYDLQCWDYPCAHFDVDNLTLSVAGQFTESAGVVVPLPAGLPLLASAAALLGLRGRSRRRGAAA